MSQELQLLLSPVRRRQQVLGALLQQPGAHSRAPQSWPFLPWAAGLVAGKFPW